MSFVDKTMTCVDCGAEFVHSAEDQEFYAEKGYQNEPKRCRDCRSQRKTATTQQTEITCSRCGATDSVPFVPRDPGNVLCGSCFRSGS